MNNKPALVSIGVPIFNGERTIARTLESLREQTHGNIEVVICDNCSTDGTGDICRRYVALDRRFRHFTADRNHGPIANFERALSEATGEYFMWLACDDWIDPDYISECIKLLEEDGTFSLVGGRCSLYPQIGVPYNTKATNLLHDSWFARMHWYLLRVTDNAIFYGVARRAVVSEVRLRRNIGGDWLFTLALAFKGKVATLEHVTLHREHIDQAFSSFTKRWTQLYSLPAWHRHLPYLSIASSCFGDILSTNPIYHSLSFAARSFVAMLCSATIFVRFCILEHLFTSRVRQALKHYIKKMYKRVRAVTSWGIFRRKPSPPRSGRL